MVKKEKMLFLFLVVGLVRGQTGPECPPKCTCDYYSAVHTIDCSSQDFDSFPDRIPAWTTSLTFDGNFLSQLDLSSFNTTVYFEKFRIRYNEIEQVVLKRDRSRERAPAKADGSCTRAGRIFPRLIDVNLKGNRLRGLPKCLLSVWPKLKFFNLNENRIASINDLHLLGHVYHYNSIEALRLRRNLIDRLRKRDWYSPASALRRVRILDLAENKIARIDGAVFMFLAELRELQLHGNQLRSIPNFAFLTMGKKLETISLNDNQINAVASKAFAGLPRLSRLDLRRNRISCLTPHTLGSCLVGPGIATAHLTYQAPLDLGGLRQLRLRGNPWTCDCRLSATTRNDVVAASFSGVTCSLPARYRGVLLVTVAERLGNCTR